MSDEALALVRSLHAPSRDEKHDVGVYCGGDCYLPGDDYDDYGQPVEWPCRTAQAVYTADEIAAQERYDLEAQAYAYDIYWVAEQGRKAAKAERERETEALMAAHRFDSAQIKAAWERGELDGLVNVDPDRVRAFLHAIAYKPS